MAERTLGWSIERFLNSTPNLWLKSYIWELESNNSELFEGYYNKEKALTIDKSPFW
ncbi:hypothetical protein P7H60_13580 [Vagococcus carniphilus]|uniref:hypothetical protein n=1 Tax=Vagococcus carniphilus TaxID=218144 RepID=UPI00289272A6|nr:hypothetical protein [Vagococcus carniphilus]MDT2850180.1 hypothetical protein [Vagococcus carniphilus]